MLATNLKIWCVIVMWKQTIYVGMYVCMFILYLYLNCWIAYFHFAGSRLPSNILDFTLVHDYSLNATASAFMKFHC